MAVEVVNRLHMFTSASIAVMNAEVCTRCHVAVLHVLDFDESQYLFRVEYRKKERQGAFWLNYLH